MAAALPATTDRNPPSKGTSGRLGLYVLLGVAGGVTAGLTFGTGPIVAGLTSQTLGDAGMLVVQVLKTAAVPLVFFGILDAILRTDVSWRSGQKLLAICAVNVTVAFVIGLTLMNVVRPGHRVEGEVQKILEDLAKAAPHGTAAPGVLRKIGQAIPETPNIFLVAMIGIAGGALLRRARNRELQAGRGRMEPVQRGVALCYEAMLKLIRGVILLVPLAVFGLMAHLVSRSGLEAFRALGVFLAVVLLGMGLHALVYYPWAVYVRTGMKPGQMLRGGLDAVITGLSTNSSLATVPVTLNCLTRKLRVSEASARLSACMGTNLNNDGITLYEAMAALFLAQACGFDLGLSQQTTVVLAALMGGIGVAGVPDAGLMILPVVLGAAGLPEPAIAAAIPMLVSVDWILARVRSAVNVMSDITVAILLDGRPADHPPSA